MTRRRIIGVSLALTAIAALAASCFLRPAGKRSLPFDEANLKKIEAGWFVYGGQPQCLAGECDNWGSENDDLFPWRLAYLTDYWIEQREVTNVEYLECVQTGECGVPDDCYVDVPIVAEVVAGIAPSACVYAHDDVAFEPVRGVSWYNARKYCRWRYKDYAGGVGDLPIEAQWERAAVGGAVDGTPFKQPALPIEASMEEENISCDDIVAGVGGSCVEDIAQPDNRAYDDKPHPFAIYTYDDPPELRRTAQASPEGLIDMAGNVAEWVLDSADTRDQLCDAFLWQSYAVSNDCYPSVDPPTCSTDDRDTASSNVTKMYWCNPSVGELSFEDADINAEHVYKGGHYGTKNWCKLNPRWRGLRQKADEAIGFRCAVWPTDPSESPHLLCPDTVQPITTSSDGIDGGYSPPDAGSPVDAG